jgi:hypothetical protein
MQLPMMAAAKRNSELITDLKTDGFLAEQTEDDADRKVVAHRQDRPETQRTSNALYHAIA